MSTKLGTLNNSSRACDTCRSAACAVYCLTDSLFLCSCCDATIHVASQHQHERVRVCDACGRAPSAYLCNADNAFLCSSCDNEIHSANPLATRHQRVPVLPIHVDDDDDVAEAASWLVLNPEKNDGDDGLLLFGGKVDENEYLELVEDCNSCGETENGFCDVRFDDCSVPHKSYDVQMQHQQVERFQLGVEFDSSKPAYGSVTVSQSVSISSTEVNSVPESTLSDQLSISDSNPAIGTTILDLSSGPPILMPSYLTYRESRVQRYKEKKKKRKFEKKIRYASRKAYAEIRPRIQGRFAKRNNNVEAETDQMFSSTLITEAGGYI